MVYAGFPSIFGLGLEDVHVPTVWLPLSGPKRPDKQNPQGSKYLNIEDLGFLD